MSQRTVAQKLLIRENYRVLLVNKPEGYVQVLGKLPLGVVIVEKPVKGVDLVQVFLTSKRELVDCLSKTVPLLAENGLLWVTYPKGSSKIRGDVNRDVIREYAQTVGLQAVALVAIDDVWSALRLKKT